MSLSSLLCHSPVHQVMVHATTSWSSLSCHGLVHHVMVQSITSWSNPSRHGPVCHIMVRYIMSSASCHGPVHPMVQSVMSWSSLSRHGPVHHVMVPPYHGPVHHIMVQPVTSWSSPSRHGPVHQELTLQHVLLILRVDGELAPVVMVVVHTQPPLGFKDVLPPTVHLLYLQLQHTGDPFINTQVSPSSSHR